MTDHHSQPHDDRSRRPDDEGQPSADTDPDPSEDHSITGSATESSETVSTDDVESALRRVRDPETDATVFDAGIVDHIDVSGESVTIEADLREFSRESAEGVSTTMVRAVSDVAGVSGVTVEQIDPSPDLDGRASGIETADRVIAVASAKGGVGKTTVATTLACALAAEERDTDDGNGVSDFSDPEPVTEDAVGDDARHSNDTAVGLFDADIYGPNVPEVLELAGPVYSDDDGNPIPVETDGLEVMSMALLSDGGPLAWRGAMAHDALSDLFEETAWSDPDTVVVDMPPGTGDVALTTLQEVPVDGVVLVTTPFHAAVSDTARALELFEENDVPVLGVVSNMGEFVCDDCGTVHDLFGGEDPIKALDVPILAELPFTPDMQATPAPSASALPDHATDLAAAVEDRYEAVWSVDPPADAVDLRGLDPETRKNRVRERFQALDSGEDCLIVSDRDPSPVHGFLVDLADADALPSFKVKRQNPETWYARATHP